MDWPFTFVVQMIESPAINPITCTALTMCLAIIVFAPKSIVVCLRSSNQRHGTLRHLRYHLETSQPVVPESLCRSLCSLLIPGDLDSTRCQQSRSEDLEHLQVATKSLNRLPGDRIARAV